MEPQDKKIEEQIKERLAHIQPPRQLFDRVTQYGRGRYTERTGKPSPYHITSLVLMKRSILAGSATAAVLVFVAIAGVSYMHMNTAPSQKTVATTNNTQQTTTQAAPAQADAVTSAQTPNAAIDATISDILQGAANDSQDVSAESNDGASLNADLQNYSDVSNTSYENVI